MAKITKFPLPGPITPWPSSQKMTRIRPSRPSILAACRLISLPTVSGLRLAPALAGRPAPGLNPLVYSPFSCRFARMNMKIKSFLARPFAAYVYKAIQKGMTTAVADQEAILKELLRIGSKTIFGTEHRLGDVKTYEDFKQAVRSEERRVGKEC